jgi:hypothetical protein
MDLQYQSDADFEKSLPKIGFVHSNSPNRFFFGNTNETRFLFQRPNYEWFRSNPYNTIKDCLSAITGVDRSGAMFRFYNKKLDDLERELSNDAYFDDDRVWDCQLIYDLFCGIKRTIDIGIRSGDIGKVLPLNGKELSINWNQDNPFIYKVLFHSLSFLNWMQQNGYPAPKELSFSKDNNGHLFWTDNKPNNINYPNLSNEEKAILAWKWKQPGPGHLTNNEINNRLEPGMTNGSATKKINRLVEKFRK